MLEEVEMPPLLHRGVVHRAVGLGALRAREAAASEEVDLDVEALPLGVERARLDLPRRHQAESELKEIGITHELALRRPRRLNPADVLAAVKTWPRSAEPAAPSACRPVLTTTPRDGVRERQVGAEGWSPIEQRDGAGGQKDQVRPVRSPTRNSEEAKTFVASAASTMLCSREPHAPSASRFSRS